MKKRFTLILLLFLFLVSVYSCYAVESFSAISTIANLNYREIKTIEFDYGYVSTLSANDWYNQTFIFNPSDGITGIQTALVRVVTELGASGVTGYAQVNGVACEVYSIDSKQSGGQYVFDFICTNVINGSGTYNVNFSCSKACYNAHYRTYVTYTNNPKSTQAYISWAWDDVERSLIVQRLNYTNPNTLPADLEYTIPIYYYFTEDDLLNITNGFTGSFDYITSEFTFIRQLNASQNVITDMVWTNKYKSLVDVTYNNTLFIFDPQVLDAYNFIMANTDDSNIQNQTLTLFRNYNETYRPIIIYMYDEMYSNTTPDHFLKDFELYFLARNINYKAFEIWLDLMTIQRDVALNRDLYNVTQQVYTNTQQLLQVINATNMTLINLQNLTTMLSYQIEQTNNLSMWLVNYLGNLNSTMYQQYNSLYNLIQSDVYSLSLSINQTDSNLLSINNSITSEFNNIFNTILNVNASVQMSMQEKYVLINESLNKINLNLTDLKNYMDYRFTYIDNNLSQLINQVDLNHNYVMNYLSVMNSTMYQYYVDLQNQLSSNLNIVSGQINQSDALLLSVNNSVNSQFNTIYNAMLDINLTNTQRFTQIDNSLSVIYNNFTNLKDYMDVKYNIIQGNLSDIILLVNSNHNDIMNYLSIMNSSMYQEFLNLQNLVNSNTNYLETRINRTDAYIISVNQSITYEFSNILNNMLSINQSNADRFTNIDNSLNSIILNLTDLKNYMDSRFTNVDNNLIQIISNLNNTENNIQQKLDLINSSMYQYYLNLQSQCNDNLGILSAQLNATDLTLGLINQSINLQFVNIYDTVLSLNQSNSERFTQIDNSLFYIIANITDLKNYMDARFITLENNLSSILSVIGNNHNEIMNYLSVLNSTIMQNYISLDSQIQNKTLYLESRINQTDYYILSINQSNADNFDNIYNTLLSLNLTNENKFILIESYLLEINSSVESLSNRVDTYYSNIQLNFTDVFTQINSNHNDLLSILHTINSSMYQNFEYLDSLTQNNTISILQSINQTDNYILSINASCSQNFNDIYNYLLLLNVSTQYRFDLINNSLYEIYLNMSDLRIYMDERFNKIDNNISQILSVISLNHNEIVDYLSVMNSTMVQNFDYLNSLIINNTNLLMSQINITDSYILSVNDSCNYHFETINDYLVSMNYNNTQRFDLVNQSLYTIYSNMTDLQNYVAFTYGNIQNNFTEIFGLINQNHNDVMIALNQMNQTINQINQTVTWNYEILLGLNQSVNDIWLWLINVLYPNVNSTNYNTQLILNKLNITLEEMNMNPITANCIYGSNWVMNLLVTDNYGYVRTDVDCNITTDLWGQDVMTFDYPYYKYVHICEPEGVIQWQITCEE